MQKQKSIEQKLAYMRNKGLPKEKLEMMETAAKNALNKVKDEMKDFQTKHFTKRAKLDEFENNINSWAIELGVEKELANIKLEEEKSETTKPKTKEQEPVAKEPVVEEPEVEEPIAGEPVVEEPAVEEPVAEDPVVEEPVVEEPVAEGPVVEEPVAEDPVVEEPVVEEPVAEGPVVEETVAEEPVVEEPVAEEPVVEEPAVEEPVNVEQATTRKLIEVKVNGKKYEFTYEENGEFSTENREKIGFFEGLKERFTLLQQGKMGYRRTAFKIDPTITQNLSESEMKEYIAFIEQRKYAKAPFVVKYDKKNRFLAKAFEKAAERLPEPLKDKQTLDEKFGDGFDQHDNPPVVTDKATSEEVKKTVRDILYGDIEQGEK